MRWIGANSFRTTHYPYSDEMLDLADRLGFLVISETPAVGLFFEANGLERRLALCRSLTRELVARDKNHPSVIAWSLANEPHSRRPEAHAFFAELIGLARELDPTRLVTLVSYVGKDETSFDLCDFVCVNRYNGWYTESGRIADGMKLLSEDLDRIHERYQKPLVLSEFGADAVPGMHAEPPEMFTEEYQAEMIASIVASSGKNPTSPASTSGISAISRPARPFTASAGSTTRASSRAIAAQSKPPACCARSGRELERLLEDEIQRFARPDFPVAEGTAEHARNGAEACSRGEDVVEGRVEKIVQAQRSVEQELVVIGRRVRILGRHADGLDAHQHRFVAARKRSPPSPTSAASTRTGSTALPSHERSRIDTATSWSLPW